LKARGVIASAAAAIFVAGLSVFFVWDHTREDSLSADEPVHILAGYLQVFGRTAIVNIEHPPLMKELAGLALTTLPLPQPPAQIPMGNQFTDYGHGLLFAGPVPPDTIAARARFPFLVVLAAMLLFLFVLARRQYGPGAALFAVALVAFDPNFVAHAGVVHTDLGAAAAFLVVIAAAERARRGDAVSVAVAGLALGVALVTKFSAVYLLPILLLQALLAARGPNAGTEALRATGRLLVMGLVAALVVFGVYAVVCSRMNLEEQRQVIHEMVAERGAPQLSRVIERIASVSPPIGHYLGGLASVVRQNAIGGGVNYLFGHLSDHGFASYFFVAFAAKSTLAFLAVTVIVLAALFREPEARAEARVWLLPVAVFFLASMGASYNIGIRHLLPVYPLLALAGAGVLSRAWQRGRRAAGLLMVGLPLLSAGELARIHPHELSYFNPLVGGPLGGRQILSDSNVDWGLDLRRLATELQRLAATDPTVVYFGGDDVPYRIGVPDFSADPQVRGRVVAISAFHQAAGPMFYAYHGAAGVAVALERLQRDIAARGHWIGRVGYSIDLYDLPPKGTSSR
jgi:4-amino-4-deoxy-L-arabinose transferase-like glycosyltransferase